MEWLTDIHEAEWIAPRLHPFLTDVGSVIPVGYDAYARIFHPVRRAGGGLESWGDVAERNGRIAHPEMQFHLIDTPRGEPPRDDVWTAEKPEVGSLPLESRRALVEHLDPVTAPPGDVWFCVWEGWGGLDDQGVDARIELPARSYLVGSGPLATASESTLDVRDQSVNMWWPHDRAWFVSTEIDYAWTYLGGPARLIEDVLADPRLEALAATVTDKPFYDSDLLNAAE